VIIISDGESTDGDPRAAAEAIRSLDTDDGPPLIMTVALSACGDEAILFPSSRDILPDEHARCMFDMASEMPEFMRDAASSEGFTVSDGARCCVRCAPEPLSPCRIGEAHHARCRENICVGQGRPPT
jgi:hypothetical protein